jgi:hypothetical protein
VAQCRVFLGVAAAGKGRVMMNTELNEVRIWRVFAMLRTAQEDLRRIGVNHNIDLQSVIDRLELASYSLIAGQNARAGNAGRCADKHAELGGDDVASCSRRAYHRERRRHAILIAPAA